MFDDFQSKSLLLCLVGLCCGSVKLLTLQLQIAVCRTLTLLLLQLLIMNDKSSLENIVYNGYDANNTFITYPLIFLPFDDYSVTLHGLF